MFAGIVVCSSYIFEFSRNVYSKWQILSCASIAFSERLYEAWYGYYTTTGPHFGVGFRTVLCTLAQAVPLLIST